MNSKFNQILLCFFYRLEKTLTKKNERKNGTYRNGKHPNRIYGLLDLCSYRQAHGTQRIPAALLRQPLPSSWAKPLSLTLPAIELATGILLAGRYKKIGLLLSIALLSSFSVYIALGLLNLYPQKPCGCASVFESLSWEWHLVVNMVLFTLSILGWYLTGPTSPMESYEKKDLSIGFTFTPPIPLGIVILCLCHTSQKHFPRKFALFPA